ncbi:MAG: hypothetical protein ABRQ37_20475, partial [Candidatus Eremiobacterota bacterium]
MTAQRNQQKLNDLAIQCSFIIKMEFAPSAWQSVQNSNRIWKEAGFPPEPRNSIPEKPGVYAFVVTPPNLFD